MVPVVKLTINLRAVEVILAGLRSVKVSASHAPKSVCHVDGVVIGRGEFTTFGVGQTGSRYRVGASFDFNNSAAVTRYDLRGMHFGDLRDVTEYAVYS